MEWHTMKAWFFSGYNWIITVIFFFAILWLSWLAITSLMAGSFWNLIFLILLLLYFFTYVVVFNLYKRRFPSRLIFRIGFIAVTWIFIALMLGVELMHSGTLRSQDGVKACIVAVVSSLFIGRDEDSFFGSGNTGGSGNTVPEVSRHSQRSERQMPGTQPDILKPQYSDDDLFEYEPYKKK